MKLLKPLSALSEKEFKKSLAEAAEAFIREIELNVEAFSLDPEVKDIRLQTVLDENGGFQFFLETYLPHYVKGEPSLFHNRVFEIASQVVHGDGGAREQFIAPRGSSKSTHVTLGLVLYCIVLNFKDYAIIVSDTYSQAALLIEALKAELTFNSRLRNDFPHAFGEGRMWREGEFITANNIKVDGVGARQGVRGRRHGPHRPDLLVMDDMENDENVQSPDQREKLWKWINKAALKLGPPDGSMDALWVGTILHFDSVLARGARTQQWNTHQFASIMQWPDHMDIWQDWEEIYQNEGEKAADGFYALNKEDMDTGAVVNWPEVQPLYFLMKERAGDHDSFASEYQNKPIAIGNPFQTITYWVKRESNLIFFGACDPSLGKQAKGRDPSAILIGGIDTLNKRMDIFEASIRKRLPDVMIDNIIEFQREYRCMLWFFEAVQFQEFARTTLVKRAFEKGVPLSAMPVTPHTDKHLRIERLQMPVKDGIIRLHKSQATLIDQLQQFPNAGHDDGPDTLDMLHENAIKYAKGGGADLSAIQGMPSDIGGNQYDDYRM